MTSLILGYTASVQSWTHTLICFAVTASWRKSVTPNACPASDYSAFSIQVNTQMAEIIRYASHFLPQSRGYKPKHGQGKVAMNIFLKTLLALSALIFSSLAMASSSEAVFERKLEQAQRGDAEAQYDLGYRYEKGRGVDEDEEEAFVWYSKSAAQGVDKSQYKVGICYLKGSGVDKDREVAKVWLEKAADQGYPPAQYQLGKLLASSRNRDYSAALVWLQRAQDNGYEPATGEIRKVKRQLN